VLAKLKFKEFNDAVVTVKPVLWIQEGRALRVARTLASHFE